mmetsp:Transcript_8398/g.20844  ORF Transcript_8398/g.20844 Transcript_8398/m.20844 type:complete len:220 (+) Transcript_8398:1473-2132(+)
MYVSKSTTMTMFINSNPTTIANEKNSNAESACSPGDDLVNTAVRTILLIHESNVIIWKKLMYALAVVPNSSGIAPPKKSTASTLQIPMIKHISNIMLPTCGIAANNELHTRRRDLSRLKIRTTRNARKSRRLVTPGSSGKKSSARETPTTQVSNQFHPLRQNLQKALPTKFTTSSTAKVTVSTFPAVSSHSQLNSASISAIKKFRAMRAAIASCTKSEL